MNGKYHPLSLAYTASIYMRHTNVEIFRYSPMPWFGLTCDYDPALVAELKGLAVKAWDQQTKTWWFPYQFYTIVEALCHGYFPNLVPLRVIYEDSAEFGVRLDNAAVRGLDTAYRGPGANPYVTLHVNRDAPDSVCRAAFEALQRDLDPDLRGRGVGGSYEPVYRVREAWAAIKKERGIP